MAVNTSFGRLWPYCDARSHLVTVIAPVSGARFPVHAGIAPIVAEGLRRQEYGIGGPRYLCKPEQCGAFNCRPIGDTDDPSNHSGGLALDINWTDNRFKCGFNYAMPEWVWKMWESLGFYWGGRYCDYMHIEWLKSPETAAAMIKQIQSGNTSPGKEIEMKSITWHSGELWTGDRWFRLICNLNDESAIVEAAWVTAAVMDKPNLSTPGEGPGTRVQVYFQNASPGHGPAGPQGGYPGGTRPAHDWDIKSAERKWEAIPPGTDFLDICVSDPQGPGDITIEMKAKA